MVRTIALYSALPTLTLALYKLLPGFIRTCSCFGIWCSSIFDLVTTRYLDSCVIFKNYPSHEFSLISCFSGRFLRRSPFRYLLKRCDCCLFFSRVFEQNTRFMSWNWSHIATQLTIKTVELIDNCYQYVWPKYK